MFHLSKSRDVELDFLQKHGFAAEVKRCICIQMQKQCYSVMDIKQVLQVSDFFISHYKKRYLLSGANGLKLSYTGRSSYLSAENKAILILYIKSCVLLSVEELIVYVRTTYGVEYKSKQSYYALLYLGGFSHHKSKKANPKKDEKAVAEKREWIKKKVESNYDAIKSGEIVVLMEDEVHLCHGDVSGYVWGKRNQAIEVKMTNQRDRQSYYGVLNPVTGLVNVQEQAYGNGECTVKFLKELPKWYPNAKQFWILWDNASYHRGKHVKDYLAIINKDLPEDEWVITCIGFATNAPEQNPIEDVWLRGKNFLRKNFAKINNFKQAKQEFFNFYADFKCSFNKFNWYGFQNNSKQQNNTNTS